MQPPSPPESNQPTPVIRVSVLGLPDAEREVALLAHAIQTWLNRQHINSGIAPDDALNQQGYVQSLTPDMACRRLNSARVRVEISTGAVVLGGMSGPPTAIPGVEDWQDPPQ